ncbi:hypothetical protein HMY34_02160 [Thiothrix subterranea]|uniref:hypothetical protein n=1 Tax=Thiothrix subterranea TaxID=2735563 RepID=UPI00192B8942|nr:hypothetical protein [Thiothrix subterranea]QQZ27648.1 hypothetical protein HMY34_02160 [Thiothrix subterranea]
MKQLLASALLFTATASVQATVSEYTEFFIPYERTQSGYVCLDEQLMEAEFGIPLASLMEGIFSETKTLHQVLGGTSTYQNINLLVNGTTTIPYIYNFDRYTSSGVFEYSFTLDMAAFNTLNGATVAGRQKTKNTAKLALIAMLKTAEAIHGAGNFRVWVKFNNLPSQTGLSGSLVHSGGVDWPTWPYTASSSIYSTYRAEMLAAGC